MVKKKTQESVIMFLMSFKFWIVKKKIRVTLLSLNQMVLKFAKVYCILSNLTPQEFFSIPLVLNLGTSTCQNDGISSIRS